MLGISQCAASWIPLVSFSFSSPGPAGRAPKPRTGQMALGSRSPSCQARKLVLRGSLTGPGTIAEKLSLLIPSVPSLGVVVSVHH
ncbi:uncharacterized protein LOC141564577 isoform X4 [Sminthopsis crassicaudata]|uniref:uncharacterized protein LOC141564577 isoform X4 n=1 Tax=Sminthopsis crassicaudata TaxID=9301 RepID=UPI003D69C6B8